MHGDKPEECERQFTPTLHALGITAVVVTCLIQVPQLIKVIKTGESGDLSVYTYVLLVVSGVLWSAYHIIAKTYHGAVSGIISSIIAVTILFFMYKHRQGKKSGEKKVAPRKSVSTIRRT